MLRLIPALLGALWSGSLLAAPAIQVEDAWIPEAPPVAPVQAGYMSVHNTGAEPALILGARSPQFGRIEIHRTEVNGGMARMVAIDALAVGAGETVALEPGGLHLMLFESRSALRSGDTVPLVLQLEGGTEVEVQAEVRSRPAHMPHGGHEHMGH